MREVFADTGYWIAVIDPEDDLRGATMAALDALGVARVVTTTAVLTEVLSHFSDSVGSARAYVTAVLRRVYEGDAVAIVRDSDELYSAGLEMYGRYLDKQWSHVDCMSFVVMQQRKIHEALAHDEHFRQAGFVTLIG